MGRFFLAVVLGFAGYVLFAHHTWEFVRPEDQLLWAAILPGAYILGMALLKS